MKNFLNNNLTDIKNTFKKYPITLCLVLLLTIYSVFVNKYNDIWRFIIFLNIEVFFIESLDIKEKKYKYSSLILSVIIAVLATYFLGKASGLELNNLLLMWKGYLSSLVILAMYFVIKRSKDSFSSYMFNLVSSLVKVFIVYIILVIGTVLLVGILSILLTSKAFDILTAIQKIIFFCYLIPAVLSSISTEKPQESKFLTLVIIYVLLPLIIAALLIVYIYIVKIIITMIIPSNQVFYIIMCIFMCLFPICILLKHLSSNKVITRINNILPYTFIPLVILQSISLIIRIVNYGITQERYVGIVFIILEIISFIIFKIKEAKYLNKLLLVYSIVIIIITITPLNMNNVSYLYQSRVVIDNISNTSFNDLSTKKKDNVKAAFLFLQKEDALDYIPDDIDLSLVKKYSTYNRNVRVSNIKSYTYYSKEDYIDVAGYKKIIPVYGSKVGNYTKVMLKTDSGTNIKEIDLSEVIDKYIIKKEPVKSIIKDNKITIDNTTIYINKLLINYNKNEKTIEYIDIDGYILES